MGKAKKISSSDQLHAEPICDSELVQAQGKFLKSIKSIST